MHIEGKGSRLQFSGQYRRYVRLGKRQDDNETPPAHGSYGGLLRDPRWLEKRQKILERDGHKCAACKATGNLQVHHRQYHYSAEHRKFYPPWAYDDTLLITLCADCNRRGHSQYKIPIITI